MIQKSESQEFDELNDKFLNFRMDQLIESNFDNKWEEQLTLVVQSHRKKFGLFDISDMIQSK